MKVRRFLSNGFHKLHLWFAPEKSKYFTPSERDLYLVSYPRSGNTWVRAILAELLYGKSGVSIQDLQFYVPDIHVRTRRSNIIAADFHVVKSHSPHITRQTKTYRQVIYVLRDPRDVVVSHYRYARALGNDGSGFENFLMDWVAGRIWPCSWQEHVNSWTAPRPYDSTLKLLVVRYEDLVAAPHTQICRLADFLNLVVLPGTIEDVIAKTSVEKMRMREQRGMPEHERADEFRFIGSATPNLWTRELSPDQAALIADSARNAMQRHGYV